MYCSALLFKSRLCWPCLQDVNWRIFTPRVDPYFSLTHSLFSQLFDFQLPNAVYFIPLFLFLFCLSDLRQVLKVIFKTKHVPSQLGLSVDLNF